MLRQQLRSPLAKISKPPRYAHAVIEGLQERFAQLETECDQLREKAELEARAEDDQ
jgi:hypothetical protein